MSAEPRTSSEIVLRAFKAADHLDGFGPSGLVLLRNELNKIFFKHDHGVHTIVGFSLGTDTRDDNPTLAVTYDSLDLRNAVAAFRCLESVGAIVRTWESEPGCGADNLRCRCFALRLPDVG